MRVTLPESGSSRPRSLGGTVVSTIVHAAVIGSIVTTTGYTAERLTTPSKPQHVVIISPRVPQRDKPMPARPVTSKLMLATNLTTPPPAEIPAISLNIRDGLPPIGARIGTIGLAEFSITPRDTLSGRRGDGASDQPYTDLMVERQVSARPGNLPPRYPDLLRSAGVEGMLHAQFVVDTTGRVERESIRFTRGGHSLFERAVVETLLRSRYFPAEAGGRKVRQLVEQAFSFALRGSGL